MKDKFFKLSCMTIISIALTYSTYVLMNDDLKNPTEIDLTEIKYSGPVKGHDWLVLYVKV